MSWLEAPNRGTYGWRARVGFITVASTLETPLHELYMMAPPGVAFVSSGMSIRRVTADAARGAWTAVADVAKEIAAYHVDHLILSGAPLAYHTGPTADRDLIAAVETASGLPTTFELTASVDGLRAMCATRIAIASPFGDAANRLVGAFMEAQGFDVRAVAGLEYDANPDITRLPLEAAYHVSRRALDQAGGADALYITCPRWPVSPIIESLEQDLGIPVVASMQSALWAALCALRIHAPITGYGRLFDRHLDGAPVAADRSGDSAGVAAS